MPSQRCMIATRRHDEGYRFEAQLPRHKQIEEMRRAKSILESAQNLSQPKPKNFETLQWYVELALYKLPPKFYIASIIPPQTMEALLCFNTS